MSEASGGGVTYVPKELASLVPGFDPSTDNVEIWTSKVELLLDTWPPDKLNELATRLILGCKGTAYLPETATFEKRGADQQPQGHPKVGGDRWRNLGSDSLRKEV